MEYTVTFANVMAVLVTTGMGVLAFFMKRWFSDMEQRDKSLEAKIEAGNASIQGKIEKNHSAVNGRIDRLEEESRNEIQEIQKEVGTLKGDFAVTFVMREDFFRGMNAVEERIASMDDKLDRMLLMLNREG